MKSLKTLKPIAVGGIGGSGTRILAQALAVAGVQMGSDQNESMDNLSFTLLFKDRNILQTGESAFRHRLMAFVSGMGIRNEEFEPQTIENLVLGDRPETGEVQQSREWLLERQENLIRCSVSPALKGHSTRWGWKEPNTHIVLDRLFEALPELRYVHMVRNGLDMAFSDNQNQLKFWGRYFMQTGTADKDPAVTPANSLSYWVRAEKRVREIGSGMKENFLIIRFEDLCRHPVRELQRLYDFAQLAVTKSDLENMARLVTLPPSLGRGEEADLLQFDDDDLAFLKHCGY